MGDSLDDFFAKKDKKKNKVKSKITPSDILCKSDVDQIKKLKKKNDKEQLGGVGLSTEAENEVAKKQAADDAEWEDFVEEKEVDLTGLRIQTLQREEEIKVHVEVDEEGEVDTTGARNDVSSGPWNSQTVDPISVQAPAHPSPSSLEPPEKKEQHVAKYIPPGRRQQAAGAAPNPFSKYTRNIMAPNIQSEEDFPSLGGATHISSGFDCGANIYRNSDVDDTATHPGRGHSAGILLENKFSVLQD